MKLLNNLLTSLTQYENEMIQIRRHLHQYPEISFQEKETFKYIMNFYKELDCEPKLIGKGFGIIVDIEGGRPGKTLALRADFDALAIFEDNDLSFKSVNPGVMHACGHDAHTAYLMVLARELVKIKQELPGRVRIVHQPAEEVSPGGAKGMIKAGALDGVDNMIGVHVMTTIKTGVIAYHNKETQTGRSNFTITIKGNGGHASMPQLSNDAIVAASYFVTELQTVISRRIDPFDMGTVTIGSFDGAGSFNAIQDKVVLKGDVRMMKETTRKVIRDQVKQIAKGVGVTFGVEVIVDYDDNYPVLFNSENLTHFVVDSLKDQNISEVNNIVDLGPQNPSEDFSYYGQVVPSTFFYIGAQPEDGGNYPHHSPLFKMNEKSILIAAKAVATVTINYLFSNKKM
ncbi:M20 family metallopeptidase [Lactobacillus delbrueckii]|uniref:M20 family metallopeptidase n=1 Tax=Lactobacillus delbrueckii TaxID=1584 RepID=A0AAW5YXF7_9LACO|nr:M20 family metallopeptidase [Lactobacillus delbrueckii]MDA3768571.1 M20 family metallopeptidase [Lactobacillus delbrueckii]